MEALVIALAVAVGLIWWAVGVAAFLFWWTYTFDRLPAVALSLAIGLMGPVAWPMGYVIHGGVPRWRDSSRRPIA